MSECPRSPHSRPYSLLWLPASPTTRSPPVFELHPDNFPIVKRSSRNSCHEATIQELDERLISDLQNFKLEDVKSTEPLDKELHQSIVREAPIPELDERLVSDLQSFKHDDFRPAKKELDPATSIAEETRVPDIVSVSQPICLVPELKLAPITPEQSPPPQQQEQLEVHRASITKTEEQKEAEPQQTPAPEEVKADKEGNSNDEFEFKSMKQRAASEPAMKVSNHEFDFIHADNGSDSKKKSLDTDAVHAGNAKGADEANNEDENFNIEKDDLVEMFEEGDETVKKASALGRSQSMARSAENLVFGDTVELYGTPTTHVSRKKSKKGEEEEELPPPEESIIGFINMTEPYLALKSSVADATKFHPAIFRIMPVPTDKNPRVGKTVVHWNEGFVLEAIAAISDKADNPVKMTLNNKLSNGVNEFIGMRPKLENGTEHATKGELHVAFLRDDRHSLHHLNTNDTGATIRVVDTNRLRDTFDSQDVLVNEYPVTSKEDKALLLTIGHKKSIFSLPRRGNPTPITFKIIRVADPTLTEETKVATTIPEETANQADQAEQTIEPTTSEQTEQAKQAEQPEQVVNTPAPVADLDKALAPLAVPEQSFVCESAPSPAPEPRLEPAKGEQ